MPNQRRAGLIYIGCQADTQLIVDLDKARGHKDRSQFIREAIAEKLQRSGIRVPEKLIYPPPRAKMIQVPGHPSVVLRAAEEPPKYRTKKRKRK